MKRPTICWGIAGLLVCMCTMVVLFFGTHSTPTVLVDTVSIFDSVEQVMTSASAGDFETLENILYGNPALGASPAGDSSAEGLIWQAYLESIEYSFPGDCYSMNNQLALDVCITCLDVSAVTEKMQEIAPAIMSRKASQITDENLVYDEAHNYLESFLNDVMTDAAKEALSENQAVMEQALTLQLVRSNGGWQVVPTNTLLRFLSGFVSG